MNIHEAERIANAINVLRPDWPVASLRTLLGRPELTRRPRRDVLVALAWVAAEANSATPARVLESGPWWKAAAADDTTTHHHVAKVYGSTEGDPREVCGECGMHRHECERRAATNGHAFISRIDAAKSHVHDDGCREFCRRVGIVADDDQAELRDIKATAMADRMTPTEEDQ